ncbi:centriolin-like [Anneissia japonica]|uniref:centriolin-like n=1 Tax=Anneissia japonica TaxID=1529436 RepID=UPI0014259A93|nr:centriolin-like [Anneissia japonica]
MKRNSRTTIPVPARLNNRNQHKNVKSSVSPLTPSTLSKHYAAENRQETSPSKYPVRYITENLIQKVSGKENVAWVTTLKLNLQKEGGKRFKYIENLEKCRHLEVLSLSCNQIEKIERLDNLTRLRELDLSFNCITHIEGLDTLVGLQKLNLSGNLIECIPSGIGKKLKRLRVLRVTRNLLFSLHDIAHLRPMRDLTQLSIEQNPLCELPHFRQYIIFQLRSIESLDGLQITHADRTNANERFEKEELENLEIQISKDNEKIRNLELNQSRNEEEMKKKDKHGIQLQQMNEEQKNAMKELQREVETKNELLRRKTAELTKACEKQYRLEQELAFYKIDHKFEPLGPYPEINNEVEDGGTEEAAYLGKAFFKRNAYAGEGVFDVKRRRILRMQQGNEMSQEKAEIEQQLQKVADDRLTEKERQIERAESRLQKLQNELRKTEQQVLSASEELKNISNVQPSSMSPEQKLALQNQLADKMTAINQLREQVMRIEDDMDRTNNIIHQKEREMAQLRRQLEKVAKEDPKHAEIQAAMKQEKAAVGRAVEDSKKLKEDMDRMLVTIAKETEALKDLEEKLVLGQADMNDELKDDLEDVIKGLTDYLDRVKKQAEECQRENQILHQEKDSLVGELIHAEQLKKELEAEKLQARQKQKHVDDLEATLVELQEDNDALQKSMNETSRHIPDLRQKLKRTQEDNERLKAALTGRDTNANDKIHALEDERESQNRTIVEYRDANEAKEQENQRLVEQLKALQAINNSMKDNLKDQEDMMNNLMNDSINPDDVMRRIEEVKERIQTRKGRLKPTGEDDQVGRSLGNLQDLMEGKLKEAKKEVQKSKERQKEAEAELREMKQRLRQPHLPGDSPVREDDRNDEIRALHEMIDDLRQQLQDPRNKRGKDEIDAVQIQDAWHDWELSEPRDTMRRMGKAKDGMEANDGLEEKIHDLETELEHVKNKLQQQANPSGIDEKSRRKPTAKSQRDIEIMKLDAIADAEAHASQTVRQAARELSKAQEEINDLEHALSEREKELVHEIDRGDTATHTIGEQQQEIGILYETLEDQKGEILRLHNLLTQALQSEDEINQENDPIQALLKEVESLRRAVIEQGERVAEVGTPKQQGILKKKVHRSGRQPYSNVGGDSRRRGLRFSEIVNGENDHDSNQQGDRSSYIQNPNTYGHPHSLEWISSGQPHRFAFTPQAPTATSTPHSVRPVHQMPSLQLLEHQIPTHQPPTHQMPPHQPPTHQMPPHQQTTHQMPPHQPPTHQMPPHQPTTHQMPPHQPLTHQVPPHQPPTHQMPLHQPPTHQIPPPHEAPPHQPSGQFTTTPGKQRTTIAVDDLKERGSQRRMEVPDDVLFCNVPEHHDLEDYVKNLERNITQLEDDLSKLENTSAKNKMRSRSSREVDDMLEEALSDRHGELEGLDLAIEKQKDRLEKLRAENRGIAEERRGANIELEDLLRGMTQLKREGEELKLEKEIVKRELQAMRVSERRNRRKEFLEQDQESEGTSTEYSSDYRGHLQHIQREIACTEKTLTKRRSELREADNLLHECEEDLQSVRQKANETLNEYDEASKRLTETNEEYNEMEKRAQERAKDIVNLETQLQDLKEEAEELDDLRMQREEELKAVEIVIGSRDAEFRSLETKTQHMRGRLQKLESDVLMSEQKILEQSSAIKDGTKELLEKNTHLNHLSTQIKSQEEKLASIMQDMAQKETELQRLTNSVDTSKQKLIMALKDGEAEVTDTERKIKEAKFKLEQLNKEKSQLSKSVTDSNRKLAESRTQMEETDKELQYVGGSIEKSKTELKHTLELIQLEKTELEALKIQHERKMAELEQTQIAVLEERAQLENLQSEVQQKQVSLECTRQQIEIERTLKEQLTEEKLLMETGINNLHREKEMLENNCESMGSKVRKFKRQQSESEGVYETLQGQLQKLSEDVHKSEKDVDEMTYKRSAMVKEFQATKHKLKDLQTQMKTTNRELMEKNDQKGHLENELKDAVKQKEQILLEVEQLKTNISQERDTLTNILSQQHVRQEELHQLLMDVERRQLEAEDSKRALESLKADLEHEKTKMITFQSQYEKKDSELLSSLSQKTADLRKASEQLKTLQIDIGNLESALGKIQRLEANLEALTHDLESRDDEKTQLAETLNFSHAEIQSLRNEKMEIQNQVLELELKLQRNKKKYSDSSKSNQEALKTMKRQIERLVEAVEEHRNRANRLNQELLETREEYIQLQQKNAKLSAVNRKEKKLEASLRNLREEIKSEVSVGLKDLELSRFEVLDELQEMHEQKRALTSQLDTLNHSLHMATLETSIDRDSGFQHHFNQAQHKDTIKERFEHEQAMLKLKIQQQVERQAEILDSVRKKSEYTLSGVKQKLYNFEELVNKSGLQSRLQDDDQSSIS